MNTEISSREAARNRRRARKAADRLTGRPERKDIEETVAGLHRQIRAVEKRAAEEDPWVLAEMLKAADELQDASVRVVKALRDAGYTWDSIAQELGITRGGACNRFAAKIKEAS